VTKTVLHIGFHKTGTTALQTYLSSNRSMLADMGFVYPDFADYNAEIKEIAQFYLAKSVSNPDYDLTGIKEYLARTSSNAKTLFLSAESVLRYSLETENASPYEKKVAYIKRLSSVLPGSEVEVVASLRNPFKLIDSYHHESVKKTYYSGSYSSYLGMFFRHYDPVSTLNAWQQVFPQIAVRQYEKDCSHQQGIVGAFMETYAKDLQPKDTDGRFNTSLSTLSIEVLRRLNPYLEESGGKARAVKELEVYSQEHMDEGRNTFWTKELLEVVQQKIQNDFNYISKKYSTEQDTSIPNDYDVQYFKREAVNEVVERLSKYVEFSILKTVTEPLLEPAVTPCSEMPISHCLSISKPKTSRLGVESEFQESKTWPAFTPEFTIDRKSKIFPIGSCFARNIEEYLVALKLNVPTFYFKAPKEEWSGRPSGILNKYSPTAIRQAIEWAANIYKRDDVMRETDLHALSLEVKGEKVIDMQLASFSPVSRQRHFERRKQIYELYRHLFSSDVVTITLGMTETWKDKTTGTYLDAAPMTREMLAEKDRFCFENLSSDRVAEELNRAISLVTHINPAAKFIITTSPVPMIRTFSHYSQTTANTYSKSTLRSACDLVLAKHPKELITYFPSYEIVSGSRSWDFWQKDLQHIKSGGVAQLVKFLTDNLIPDLSDDERDRLSSRAFSTRKEREVALSFAEAVAKRTNDSKDIEVASALRTSFGR